MNKIKYYIASFRLRTLPLSLSGIIMGSKLACSKGYLDWKIFGWTVITTLSLQILSNLANELGDLQKGTDNNNRIGPIRSIQSGLLNIKEFKHIIVFFVLLSAFSGSILIYNAFNSLLSSDGLIMLCLGAAAIIAAIKYTMGKGAYGYYGLGDLFVFLFFGLLSVNGSYFLMCHTVDFYVFLPASSIGMLSMGVLNLNNMRDIENDTAFGKRTIPVIIGITKAKIYHFILIFGAFLCMIIYSFLQKTEYTDFLYLVTLPLFIIHLCKVRRYSKRELDSQLKILSLSTLLFSILG